MNQDAQNQDQNTNPYAAPQAELTPQSEAAADFYIVGKTKFLLLFVATLSLYGVYWFYRQWQAQKQHDGSDIWPAPRGIFSIFFTTSLTKLIDLRLKRDNIAYEWTPNTVAGVYIFFSVLANACTHMANKSIGVPVTDLALYLTLPAVTWAVWKMQDAINHGCGDEKGETNSSLTVANYIWLAIGALMWVLVLLGTWVALGGEIGEQ
jgi:hypothetical protein